MNPTGPPRPRPRLSRPRARGSGAGDRLPYARHRRRRRRWAARRPADAGPPRGRPAVRDRGHRGAELPQGRARRRCCAAIASSRFVLYHHVIRREVRPSWTGEFADAVRARARRRLARAARRPAAVRQRPVPDAGAPPAAGPGGLSPGAARPEQARGRRESRPPGRDRRELDAAAREPARRRSPPYGARLLGVYDSRRGPCSEPLEFLSCPLQRRDAPGAAAAEADLGQHLPYRRVSFGARRAGAVAAGRAAAQLRAP